MAIAQAICSTSNDIQNHGQTDLTSLPRCRCAETQFTKRGRHPQGVFRQSVQNTLLDSMSISTCSIINIFPPLTTVHAKTNVKMADSKSKSSNMYLLPGIYSSAIESKQI